MRFVVTLSLLLPALAIAVVDGPSVKAESTTIPSGVDGSVLSKKKRTKLSLYVTAEETHKILQKRQDIALIDVRTPEETMFVGFPQAAAANIPFKLVDPKYAFSAKKNSYKLLLNSNFVESVRSFLSAQAGGDATTLILMCRSGGRSADAVDALADAGFRIVYSMIDGFEGDKDKSGRRTVNGWKNAGAPWTTRVRGDYWYRTAK